MDSDITSARLSRFFDFVIEQTKTPVENLNNIRFS